MMELSLTGDIAADKAQWRGKIYAAKMVGTPDIVITVVELEICISKLLYFNNL